MATSVSSSTSSTATTPVADSASIGSALATAIGGGTGLDMTQLATNLATAQFAGRLAQIDKKADTLTTQISQATQLKSDLLTLASSFGTEVRSGSLSSQPSVANSTVATASLPLGSSGINGSYSLEVSQLAASQVLNSTAYPASTSTPGAGSLTITFGTVSGSSFAADSSHAPLAVTIAPGATLADVASAINAANGGVTAYVATAADGAHLVLKGQQGAVNGFTVAATEDPANPGLSSLNWDPASATTTSSLASTAVDAQFKLDGIARTSPTNTVDSVAPGLSLKLTGTNAGAPTQITYSDPSANIKSMMQDFTTALNSLVGEMKGDLDPASGSLAADSGTRALRAQLSQLTGKTIMTNAATGEPATLSDIGLSVAKDGSYVLDTAKLSTVLKANPSAVAGMFTTGLYGIYSTLDSLSRNLSTGTDPGSLGGSITRYTSAQKTLATQRAKIVAQQDKLRTQLVDRFAHANTLVNSSKSTLTYLQNQIAAWNKSGN